MRLQYISISKGTCRSCIYYHWTIKGHLGKFAIRMKQTAQCSSIVCKVYSVEFFGFPPNYSKHSSRWTGYILNYPHVCMRVWITVCVQGTTNKLGLFNPEICSWSTETWLGKNECTWCPFIQLQPSMAHVANESMHNIFQILHHYTEKQKRTLAQILYF